MLQDIALNIISILKDKLTSNNDNLLLYIIVSIIVIYFFMYVISMFFNLPFILFVSILLGFYLKYNYKNKKVKVI